MAFGLLNTKHMKTSDHQWKKSTFVSAAHVVQKQRNVHRPKKRLSTILRANQVQLNPKPVVIGDQTEKIRLNPIFENGQIKALRVTCACGCEATFDIQYAGGGERGTP
jgi:hypothetical protein